MTNPIIDQDGDKFWRDNKGELHRVNGPAVELDNGDKYWYLNGELHRVDGPAIELANGDKEWWQHGLLHRIYGPAIERTNGDKEWWQYNIQVDPNIKINHNLCKRCKQKCHNESQLINIPIECKYGLEHVIS